VLWTLWTLSLALGALSISVMVVLIIRRVVSSRRDAHDALGRRRVMTAMIRLAHDGDEAAFLAAAEGVSDAVIADASSEFLGLVRGAERESVLAALGRTGQPAFLEKEAVRGNEAQRLHAVELIAAYPLDSCRAVLQDRLDRDKSHEVRLAAAIELAKLGAIPDLATLLGKIGLRGQRSRRVAELFRLLPADSEPQLNALARDREAQNFLRAAAIEASWRRDGQAEPTIFAELVDDPVPEVVAAALRALGHVTHRPALPLLLAKLHHPDWEVRLEAADALGRLGEPSACEPLGALLDDEQWTVRYAAAKALQRLGADGLERLRSIAAEEPSRKQRTASLFLSEGASA
jgi:HEAT repeat protein